jgi:hypothetical protein
MELRVEVEGGEANTLPGGGSAMIAFMSFAVSRGFGATHPLIVLADRLEAQHGVRMGPLTTFYEGAVEDAEDAEKLEMAWQEADGLAESLRRMEAAMTSDGRCAELTELAGAEGLPGQVAALRVFAGQAAEQGRRIRLSYAL